jgi:hypothetical protein
MDKKKPFDMKPVILVASHDHVWLSEIQERLARLGSIVLPAVWEYEVREVVEYHRDKLGLAVLDADFKPVVPDLTELRVIRPKLRIIGCADSPRIRKDLARLGCTDIFPTLGRPLMDRITEIVMQLKSAPKAN